MNKYFYLLSFALLIISCAKDNKNFTPTTKLENILKDKRLNKTYYEFRLEKPYLEVFIDTTKAFKKFISNTKIEELLMLTECEQPIVRCIAFKALVEKDYPEIKKILYRHKNDEEIVNVYSRCIELHTPVKSYMLELLRPFASNKNKEFLEMEKEFYKK